MGEVIGNSIPWEGENDKEEKTTASETASGGGQSVRWVTIGENLNPAEAMIIKGRLESEDIPAVVQQEALGSFLGLTVGPLGSAKVLVPESLADRALAILAVTFEVDEEDEEEQSEP